MKNWRGMMTLSLLELKKNNFSFNGKTSSQVVEVLDMETRFSWQ
jgi:hypothetical protein